MKRKYLYILIALLVIATAGYFLIRNSNGNGTKFRTEKVTRGDIVRQVRATGTINPIQSIKVGSQVSGTIAKIFVDFNSQVKQGQVIAQIDPTFLQASVKEAEANLERNRAQMTEAERNFARTKELFAKTLVSQADLDAAQTSYEAAVAQLKQSQAALDRAQVNLRFATIKAPVDGVVISRDVDVGQTVASSLQAPQLFVIANDLRQMRVEASVDEADIGQIKESQMATFTVDSYPEEEFRGTVTQVRLAPVTVQNVVTYTVVIDVPNPDLKLRPGMTATVSILVDRRSDALRVPTLAIRFQPPADMVDESAQAKPAIDSSARRERTNGNSQREGRRDTSGLQSGQRRRWNREGGQSGGQERMQRSGGGSMGRVWLLTKENKLKATRVWTGLSDSRFVEIRSQELKEGDEVIVGMVSNETTAQGPGGQTNPFAPQRMPGGGGGGGRRGP